MFRIVEAQSGVAELFQIGQRAHVFFFFFFLHTRTHGRVVHFVMMKRKKKRGEEQIAAACYRYRVRAQSRKSLKVNRALKIACSNLGLVEHAYRY